MHWYPILRKNYYQLNTARNLTNGTAAQSIFGVGFSCDAGTTYEFEAFIGLATGTTSHNVSVSFLAGGGLTLSGSSIFTSFSPSTSGATGGAVIDGHSALTTADNGYRILLIAQSTGSENGIYELLADGETLLASRPADADSYEELIGAAVFVMEGTQYENTSWVQSNHYLSAFTSQSWTQFSGSGTMIAGDGIAIDGLEVSVVGSDSITSSPTGIAVELATDSGLEIKSEDGLAVKVGYGLTVTGDTVYNNAVITVEGTENQVSVSHASGDVTISLPQDINSSADVDFGTLTLTGALTATAINLNNSRVGSANGTAGTSATIVDSFLVEEYTSGKYVVQLKHNNDIEVIEILLTVDGNNNVYLTEYADVISNYQLGTTDAAFDSGTVNLLVTAVNAGTSVKIHKTLIEA